MFNLTTYPHLVAFFDALGIDSEPSNMSFSLSVDSGRLEWASHSLATVFAQRSNALSPSFLGMVRDVLRFGREAPKVLTPEMGPSVSGMSLGDYLLKFRYSQSFIDNYILPMCAAVWSVPASQVLDFPVVMLVRFWVNHHLLDITERPVWRVVKGRSQEYVKKVLTELTDVRVSTAVKAIRSMGSHGPVEVETESGAIDKFDAVVCATHSDVTAKLLEDSTTLLPLKEALEDIPYSENDVWLHTDATLMPRNRNTWASWNCLTGSGASAKERPVCVTYWVNSLQTLPPGSPDIFVTLNPTTQPSPDKVYRRLPLSHPVFTEASVAARQRVCETMQGLGGVYLAGAWCGYGFHEDGIVSAIAVVRKLGASIPWIPRSTSPKLSFVDATALKVFDKFAQAAIRTGRLRLILPTGEERVYGSPEAAASIEAKQAESWRGRPPLHATVRIYDAAFFRKVISRHDTGLGESYMDGDYEVIEGLGSGGDDASDSLLKSGDLGSLMAIATANAVNIESTRGMLGIFNRLGSRALLLAHKARSNTVFGSRRNIEEHYDAGNAMYKLFLDKSMTYSCGIWDEGKAAGLYEAQMNKLDALIAKAELTADHHVLEIGCGWGSFAIRAASTVGCRVTGLTLSKEQLAEATARVKAAGLEDKVRLLFCDYRDCPEMGTYDRVVSCEMIEAVGQEHLRAYFMTVGAALKPGGRAVIQVIAEPDERYEAYCASSDFIREHIFPGGHLPSVGACVEASRGTGLSVHGLQDIGPDYAVTLRAWRAAWEEKKDAVLALGYSERFWRKYRFYFVYCEAAFDAKYIHTFQMTWVKDSPVTHTSSDVAAALERSKRGLPVALPVEDAPSSSRIATPMSAAVHNDAWTQILMYLYFFLAGAAVSTSKVLWILPLVTALSAVLYMFSAGFSGLVFPFYRNLSVQRATLWNLQAIHLLYSIAAALCAIFYVATNPIQAVTLSTLQPSSTLPRALAAASAGFFGFVLWTEVSSRLYKRNYVAVIHYTMLLVLFSAAAHKSVNLPFLSVSLLSEINSVFLMVRRLCDLAGLSGYQQRLSIPDAVSFVTFRLILHMVMGLVLSFSSQAFPNRPAYWLACAGMAYMNGANIKHGIALLRGSAGSTSAGGKVHAA